MDLPPAIRRQAEALWAARSRDESRAVVAMSQLLRDLARFGAPLDVLAAAADVVREEADHVDVCRELAEAFGGATVDEVRPEVPEPKTKELRARITVSVASLLCVGETLSAALLRAARDECPDPVATETLEYLLTDESVHARFGWWWLETPQGALREEEIAPLEAMLRRLFGKLDRSMAAHGDDAEAPALPGVPSAATRAPTFRRTVEGVIVPRFEALGIGAAMAWEERVS